MNWLVSPELYKALEDEFGEFEFDPCPFPHPEWNGLEQDWSNPCFVNPPFNTKDGGPIYRWLVKGIEEWKKGKTIVFLLPCMSHWRALDDIIGDGVEMRFIGRYIYYDTETKQPGTRPPNDSVLLILRGR